MSLADRLKCTDVDALKAVLGAQFLNGFGFGLIFPIAALCGESFGLPPAAITALVALHPIARVVTGPVWGWAADHYGRRPVLLAGIALQSVGHLVFGFAGGPAGLAVGRLLTGLGSADAVAITSIVADITPPETRAQALGLVRAAGGVGMLTGPLIGAGLGLIGLGWPARLAGLMCMVNLLQAVWTVPETRRTAVPAERGSVGLQGLYRGLWIAGAAAASLALAESILALAIEHVLVPALVLPPWITAHQATLVLAAGVILGWGMTTATFDGVLSARLVERFGERAVLLAGLVGWSVAFALTPPVYRLGLVPGALAVVGAAVPASLTGVALSSWISKEAGAERQGRAMGAVASAMALGECCGPLLGGALYQWNYALPYWVAAVVLAIAAVVAIGVGRSHEGGGD